jgi:hypothetical protein
VVDLAELENSPKDKLRLKHSDKQSDDDINAMDIAESSKSLDQSLRKERVLSQDHTTAGLAAVAGSSLIFTQTV